MDFFLYSFMGKSLKRYAKLFSQTAAFFCVRVQNRCSWEQFLNPFLDFRKKRKESRKSKGGFFGVKTPFWISPFISNTESNNVFLLKLPNDLRRVVLFRAHFSIIPANYAVSVSHACSSLLLTCPALVNHWRDSSLGQIWSQHLLQWSSAPVLLP